VTPIAYSNQWTADKRHMLMGTSMKAVLKSIQDYKERREAVGAKPSELADRPIDRIRP
jgi:hypothetical protein